MITYCKVLYFKHTTNKRVNISEQKEMADKNLSRIIGAVVITILIISIGLFAFIVLWIPAREGGAGVRVAILDSGIKMDVRIGGYRVSQELKDAVVMAESFVTTEYGYSENATYEDDTDYHHGTLVALQIAGRSFGIAPQAELVIAKCADAEGTSTYPALLAAFNWAVKEAKADIINISIGGPLLINNTIVEAINKAALEEGVLTVVSSGNSGDADGYSLTSIEGPADALQCIAVGASDAGGVAEYSSIGPLKDHSIKPDLVDSGFTLIAIGTSFAAPKVAAKAAVLQSWCIEQGYKTSPGLLKASLMHSATIPVGHTTHEAGAGIAEIDDAKTYIESASKVNDWPLVTYIHPNSIPFAISEQLYKGDVWSFPITIITPTEQEFSFSSDLSPSESVVDIPNILTINQSGLVDCRLVIPDAHPNGSHTETIIVSSSLGENLAITVNLNITTPTIKIGFDVYHSFWEMDHLFGQFNEMFLELSNRNISMVELNHLDNFSQLADYDALIMPDPNAYGFLLNNEASTVPTYNNFTTETIDYIVNYVEDGHGLFVIGTDNDSACLPETNKLMNHFNISFTEETIPEVVVQDEITGNYNIVLITEMNSTHPVTASLINFDYLGAKLEILGDNALPLAWHTQITNVALAAYESENNTLGRVVVSGSNFFADNWGINDEYTSYNNLELITSVIEWITNETVIEPPHHIVSSNSANKPAVTQFGLSSFSASSSNSPILTMNQIDMPVIYVIDQKRRK
ncbi:MAG: S8 family serine peptidase [Asgard group archaeon]|nr:S8 family serine peptidase [Asgard group archaeon]